MTSFQSQLTSFQRNFSDDEQEGLVDTAMGDDDVLMSSETPSIVQSKNEAKSRFFLRIWSWIQSKYKHVSYRPASRSRKRSVEFHTKRIFNTKMTSNGCNRKQEQITLVHAVCLATSLVLIRKEFAASGIRSSIDSFLRK